MRKAFRILFKSIAAIVALLMVAIVILIFSHFTVNLDFMRGGVEIAASTALNRKVSIEGPVELEFSNWPALNVSNVKIANVKGGTRPYLLNAEFVRMQLGAIPLLKGEINIADITAQNVILNLESNVDGDPNWALGKPDNITSEKENEADSVQNSEHEMVGDEKRHIIFAALSHLSLSQISINYRDDALGKSWSFVLDSMEGSAAEGQPIELELNGRVQDGEYNLVLEGGSILDLFQRDKAWGFKTRGEIFTKPVIGEGNILLGGEHPIVHLILGVQNIDVGQILARLGLVEGMQASLGDVSMDITVKGDSLQEMLNKSSMVFAVKNGNWTVTMPNTDASFDIHHLNGNISVEQGNNITMELDGTIKEVPLRLLITGAPLVEYVTNQEELPLSIDAELLETKLSFDADIKLPVSSTNMSFALKVSSQKIDRLNTLLDIELPPIGPVSLDTKLDIRPQAYDLSELKVKIGKSDLYGHFKLDFSRAKPKLDISLVSELLQLNDFAKNEPRQGDESQPKEVEKNSEPEVESDKTDEGVPERNGKHLLSYEVLNAVDADIEITSEQVLSGQDMLGSAKVKLVLNDARLKISPIRLDLPGGLFNAHVDYAPSLTDMAIHIAADIERFDFGVLIRHLEPDSEMGGQLSLDVILDSRAPDVASIMANASGHFDFGLVPQNFSAGVVDLWAVNLLSAIMDKSTEKDQSVVNCVVVRTRMQDGVLKEEAIYLDTSNMRIAGKTDINFKTRKLEIKLAPKAKHPEFFSVAIPIQVKGTLDDFGLKIGVLRMAGQVVSFLTSPIHVPIRRVFTESSPKDGVEACTHAWTVTAEDVDEPGHNKPEKEY